MIVDKRLGSVRWNIVVAIENLVDVLMLVESCSDLGRELCIDNLKGALDDVRNSKRYVELVESMIREFKDDLSKGEVV